MAGWRCESTRMDHRTCTSSSWQDLTSLYRMRIPLPTMHEAPSTAMWTLNNCTRKTNKCPFLPTVHKLQKCKVSATTPRRRVIDRSYGICARNVRGPWASSEGRRGSGTTPWEALVRACGYGLMGMAEMRGQGLQAKYVCMSAKGEEIKRGRLERK
jgi:hypothetical protein